MESIDTDFFFAFRAGYGPNWPQYLQMITNIVRTLITFLVLYFLLYFRNRLDDNDYAVKRIPLDSKSERLNQKIKREAKLFSKLNHEHVVRYYAAWIESMPTGSSPSSISKNSLSVEESLKPVNPKPKKRLDTLNEDEVSSFRQIKSSSESLSTSSDEKNPQDGPRGKLWQVNKSMLHNSYSVVDARLINYMQTRHTACFLKLSKLIFCLQKNAMLNSINSLKL